jgi:adenosine/AMP kinase
METRTVTIEKPEEINFILGQSHFIKTVEDLHEAMAAFRASSSAWRFAKPPGLPGSISGTDEASIELAKKNALAIGAGHSFIIFWGRGSSDQCLESDQEHPGSLSHLLRHANL